MLFQYFFVLQECVPERLELKKSVWQKVDQYVGDDTIMASSTSSMPASTFTSELQHKQQCIVAHPVRFMHAFCYNSYVMAMSQVVLNPFMKSTRLPIDAVLQTIMCPNGKIFFLSKFRSLWIVNSLLFPAPPKRDQGNIRKRTVRQSVLPSSCIPP